MIGANVVSVSVVREEKEGRGDKMSIAKSPGSGALCRTPMNRWMLKKTTTLSMKTKSSQHPRQARSLLQRSSQKRRKISKRVAQCPRGAPFTFIKSISSANANFSEESSRRCLLKPLCNGIRITNAPRPVCLASVLELCRFLFCSVFFVLDTESAVLFGQINEPAVFLLYIFEI